MGKRERGMQILVVGKEQKTNKLLCEKIEELGLSPTIAYTGKEAVALLERKQWDIMFLEYELSDTDAGSFVINIKKRKILPLLFVIVSSFNNGQAMARLMSEGARDYWIIDDTFMDTLQRRVMKVVEEARLIRKNYNLMEKIGSMEQQIRKVLDGMTDPVVVINKEKKIVFRNRAFRDTFNSFGRQQPCYTVIYNKKTPCPWCSIEEVSGKRKNTFSVTRRVVEKNGHFYQPALSSFLRFNGERKYFLEILRDVTESVVARQRAEKNEIVLRNLIGSTREAIVGVNKKGKVVLHNKAALKLFKEKSHTIQLKNFLDFFVEDKYLFRFRRLFSNLLSGNDIPLTDKSFRLNVKSPDQEGRIIETNMSVNKINGDQLYLFVMRDMTRQYQVEKELFEQRLLIRSLIDNLPDHIYYKDTQLRFLLSNKAHNIHLGVSSEEKIIGKQDHDFYPEELAEKYLKDEEKVIHTKNSLLNLKEKTIDKNGEIRWLLTSKIPVIDGYGKVKGIVGIGRDITGLELKEQELRKSRRRLEGLLEISLGESLDISTILDLALEKCIELTESEIGYIYFYNEDTRTFTLHNWSKSTMEQCTVLNKGTIFPLERTGIWGEAVRQRKPVLINNYHGNIPDKKGLPKGHVPVNRFITIPVFSQGRIVAVTGVANKKQPYEKTDLIQLELLMNTVWKIIVQKQQQKELIEAKEKAEESDKLKTVFMSTMSHELRTPLNAILGFSNLLEKTVRPEEVQEYARYITQGGERLLSIIDNIFYVSAVEGKMLRLEEEEADPGKMISSIVSHFTQHKAPEKVQIMTDCPVHVEKVIIKTDIRKTEQILRTLMDNALKFTPSGSIVIGYRVGEKKITYFVKDTGIGIPEDKRTVIFEKFRQLDERLSREFGGIGIGLYLARRLVEMLNGRIWVEDNIPGGSIFYVNVPVEIVAGSSKMKIEKISEPSGNIGNTKTVLIAEDNPMSALLLKKIMKEMGMVPVHAQNGKEAVDYLRESNPCDLILMDLNMPVMDGFEAIKKIKMIREDIPIIIQTAYDSENGRARAHDLKVQDFISKPVNREKLHEKVIKYITGVTNKNIS